VKGTALGDLPPARQAHVLAALAAVETADAPVPRAAFRALADGTLRATLDDLLAEAGRVLLEADDGFLSGYDDQVAHRLVAQGVGILPPDDRAVLTLVLLHTVAIPRARGTIPPGADWSVAQPVERERLKDSRLPDRLIDAGLRRLRDAGILRPGQRPPIAPGPQFARLTPAASASLFEELVLLCEPDGALADSIRRRRAARTGSGTTTAAQEDTA
jgi:hypothetical protein